MINGEDKTGFTRRQKKDVINYTNTLIEFTTKGIVIGILLSILMAFIVIIIVLLTLFIL